MSRILVWRAGGDEGLVRTRKKLVVNINDDVNDATVIGKPRGPEQPICRHCGKDCRHSVSLKPFVERRENGDIASGWRCA